MSNEDNYKQLVEIAQELINTHHPIQRNEMALDIKDELFECMICHKTSDSGLDHLSDCVWDRLDMILRAIKYQDE